MAPPVLSRVIHGPYPPQAPAPLKTVPALLPHYCRHRVRGLDYPAIIFEAENEVRGTFVEGLSDGDIWRLDLFEGDEYLREQVNVNILEGEDRGREMVAETYVWIAGQERLEKGEWDFEVFRRERMQDWVGGGGDEGIRGEQRLQRIREQMLMMVGDVDEAVENDKTGGRGLNGHISSQLFEQDTATAQPAQGR
jgi:hypothetical protein